MDVKLLQSYNNSKSPNLSVNFNEGQVNNEQRRQEAFQVRQNAALFQKHLPLPRHPNNNDEILYPNKIGNYSIALPHNQLGKVDINAYQTLIKALDSGNPDNFETLTLGGTAKLVNPQAAYAFDLVSADSHHLAMIPPPTFSSAQEASEMAEAYWQALTRDVPFVEYKTDPLTSAAAADLSNFSDFQGPKINNKVTTKTLFRGDTPGDIVGPYISQFLWQDIPFGATTVHQKYCTPVADVDYLTSYEEWLNIQNGGSLTDKIQLDPIPRFIRDNRGLSEWVHRDFSCQGIINACLILVGYGEHVLSQTNPYLRSLTQVGFATFGIPHILDFITKAVRIALEAAWFQKWLVHRRLRPEEFGGRVQNLLINSACYPINHELLNSQAISEVFKRYGTYLLPQAYPEGCPTHPAYPSGHACYIGAGVTVLKAFFDESFVITNPVVASPDGLTLCHYLGEPLTVLGELNKLAANIAIGRNAAGVHWRTDAIQGMRLGEQVAIGLLQDYSRTYNENFAGFTLTKFDGTTVTI